MSFPTGVDYLKTIQSPATALAEPALRACTVDRNLMGQPLSWAGSNAIVFRLRTAAGQPLALRCFTQKIPDVELRYQAYAEFYRKAPMGLKKALVGSRYLPGGIQVPNGSSSPWKPIVIMTWVEGRHLGAWVEAHRSDPAGLAWMQGKLKELGTQMTAAKFVHGDLQHRNILVGTEGPVLVDYDSVLLPGASGLTLTTQGLAAFRHPRASKSTSPAALDRFAFLVLHVGLEALIRQPNLYDHWGKVEGLLFEGADLQNPPASRLFQTLRAHPDLRRLAEALAQVCQAAPAKTPDITSFLDMAAKVPAAQPIAQTLPTWNTQHLNKLQRLYAPKPETQVVVHRVEVEGPYRSPAQLPVQQTTPHAAIGAAVIPAFNAAQVSGRSKPRVLRAGLFMACLLMLVYFPFYVIARVRTPEGLATIRKDLHAQLERRKDHLLPLIVHMDEELEAFRALPDDLCLATLDPAGGEVTTRTAAQMRRDLAQSREQARQALIRCDALLESFDTTLGETKLTPSERVERLAIIPDLPPGFPARIRRELRGKGTP